MIAFDKVSIWYDGSSEPTLSNVTLDIPEGELILVAGPTGSGKSTLLGAINGHVPHFTGGTLTGTVRVDGIDTATNPPRDLAHLVGVVAQDPLAGFVTDVVEEELAYTMEQLGVDPATMRVRVEETLDILGIADLRSRPLATLSGGQQQRVAIGSVLAAGVRVLVLDEPTSALDPVSSEEVISALLRLVHDLGLTVVVAEHRLERVLAHADRMIILDGSGGAVMADPAQAMVSSAIVPPVVELGRELSWSPLPLSVREARRMAGPLKRRLEGLQPDEYIRLEPPTDTSGSDDEFCLVADGVTVVYGSTIAVDHIHVSFPSGCVTAVMGRNGSGKSSLLWALTGVQPMESGRVTMDGQQMRDLSPSSVRGWLRLVPQSATDLLYLPTVAAECEAADKESGSEKGTCAGIMGRLAGRIDLQANPRDLSAGQQLALVLAIQLSAHPRVLLLDEPTRGLDYPAKHELSRILTQLAISSCAVGVVTHDVEFAAEVADRALVMANGEVIQEGPVGDVLGASALFAPQTAKVLYPDHWLTPYQVGQALGGHHDV